MRFSVANGIRAALWVALTFAVCGCAASDHTSYKVGSHVYEDSKPVPPRARTVVGQPANASRQERGE